MGSEVERPRPLLKQRVAFAALIAFVFAIPWEGVILVPGLGTISRLVGIAALALGLWSVVDQGVFKLRRPSLFLALMTLLVFWMTLSYFWSVDPQGTLGSCRTLVQLVLMVWLIWQLCQTQRDSFMIMQAYVLGCYVALVSLYIAYFSADATHVVRATIENTNPNRLGMMLALGIPLAWHLVRVWKSPVLYWANLLYLPLAFLAAILTASRGGFILTLLALSVVPLTYKSLSAWRRLGFLVMLCLIGYATYALMPLLSETLQPSLDRLSTIGTELTQGDINSRSSIWQAGLKVFIENPVVGVGYGDGAFRVAVEEKLGYSVPSHNAFVAIAVETGLVGLGLFLALFVVVILPLWGLRPSVRTFYLILLVTLIVGLMPSGAENEKVVWFVLVLPTLHRALVLGEPRQVGSNRRTGAEGIHEPS